MKKTILSLLVLAMLLISSLCFAATAEEARYGRQYTYGSGYINGVCQGIFEAIEADDIARLTKFRDRIGNDQTFIKNVQLIGTAGTETGAGVSPAVFSAFRNSWRCNYQLMKPVMEEIVLKEGPIRTWTNAEKTDYKRLLIESENADMAYRREMAKVGIRE